MSTPTAELQELTNKSIIELYSVELKADVNYRDLVIADDYDNVGLKYGPSKPDNLETISVTTLPLSIVRGGPRDFRQDTIENTVAEILLNAKADINTYIQTDNII